MEKGIRSETFSKLIDALLPVFAVLAALAIGALMIIVLGANPIEAFGALLEGAFGSPQCPGRYCGQSNSAAPGWSWHLYFFPGQRD